MTVTQQVQPWPVGSRPRLMPWLLGGLALFGLWWLTRGSEEPVDEEEYEPEDEEGEEEGPEEDEEEDGEEDEDESPEAA